MNHYLYCDHTVTLGGNLFVCLREPHKGNQHYMAAENADTEFTDQPHTLRALARTFALLVGVPIGTLFITVLTASLVIHR